MLVPPELRRARPSSEALALRLRRPYPSIMARRARLVASVLLCGALSACGASHFVKRGADLYAERRYVEADEVFERSQPRIARASLTERATYATYRGATFLALGDLDRALHWLNVAAEIERARPGTLRENDARLLAGAGRALMDRTRAPLPAPTNAGSARGVSSSAQESPLEPPANERQLLH